MSQNLQSSVNGASSIASDQQSMPISRRTALKGLAGASLVSLVGFPGIATASATNTLVHASSLDSTVTGMATGVTSIAELTGSPGFVDGDYGTCSAPYPYGDSGLSSASAWIWGSPDGVCTWNEPDGEAVRVEEEWELNNLNGTFTLAFSADNKCAAYVNGDLVGTNTSWSSSTSVELTNLGLGTNTIEIRASNDGGPAALRYELWGPEQPTSIALDIDVKPGNGDEVDPINPSAKGVIPVAVYSTADFDATTLDASTLRFGSTAVVDADGGADAAHGGHAEDVDGDGLVDLMLHFSTQDAGFEDGDTEAMLVGQTDDGTDAVGTDEIRTVGGKGKGKGRGR